MYAMEELFTGLTRTNDPNPFLVAVKVSNAGDSEEDGDAKEDEAQSAREEEEAEKEKEKGRRVNLLLRVKDDKKP
eukprot:CAMPEP_0119196556 /NCGR_PEP_ID=MMETSP1316-20130426/10649_1 /TAXON_ID=41880 /ORGANISM="Pycnococcus provasolii, Strain RCC2336" /LENGTH=74 /DNA_ID=CAMNT_0007192259 /DNA_START=276 /DNA_END=500 /DNA_ORIENTATION=-